MEALPCLQIEWHRSDCTGCHCHTEHWDTHNYSFLLSPNWHVVLMTLRLYSLTPGRKSWGADLVWTGWAPERQNLAGCPVWWLRCVYIHLPGLLWSSAAPPGTGFCKGQASPIHFFPAHLQGKLDLPPGRERPSQNASEKDRYFKIHKLKGNPYSGFW